MDMFKMMKQAMNMKSKMKAVQKELAGKSAEVDRGGVQITLSCDLRNVQCRIDEKVHSRGVGELGCAVAQAVEEVLAKAKEQAAAELKKALGGLDPGGLMDMLK